MADGVNPLDHAIRQNDTEIHVVIGFLQNCPLNRALPFKTIVRVDAFEPLFPHRRSLIWIKTVNPVPLLGEVYCTAIRRIPAPTARLSSSLRFSQLSFASPPTFPPT